MKPSLSAAYEVVKSYLLPHADLVQQPEFFVRFATGHVSKLPVYVICNGYSWYIFDQRFKEFVCEEVSCVKNDQTSLSQTDGTVI